MSSCRFYGYKGKERGRCSFILFWGGSSIPVVEPIVGILCSWIKCRLSFPSIVYKLRVNLLYLQSYHKLWG